MSSFDKSIIEKTRQVFIDAGGGSDGAIEAESCLIDYELSLTDGDEASLKKIVLAGKAAEFIREHMYKWEAELPEKPVPKCPVTNNIPARESESEYEDGNIFVSVDDPVFSFGIEYPKGFDASKPTKFYMRWYGNKSPVINDFTDISVMSDAEIIVYQNTKLKEVWMIAIGLGMFTSSGRADCWKNSEWKVF